MSHFAHRPEKHPQPKHATAKIMRGFKYRNNSVRDHVLVKLSVQDAFLFGFGEAYKVRGMGAGALGLGSRGGSRGGSRSGGGRGIGGLGLGLLGRHGDGCGCGFRAGG